MILPGLAGAALTLAALLFAPARADLRDHSQSSDVLQVAQEWNDLSPEDRERALRNYERYQSLSPEKREDVEKRYEKWKRLPSAERDRYRRRYEDYRGRGLLGD